MVDDLFDDGPDDEPDSHHPDGPEPPSPSKKFKTVVSKPQGKVPAQEGDFAASTPFNPVNGKVSPARPATLPAPVSIPPPELFDFAPVHINDAAQGGAATKPGESVPSDRRILHADRSKIVMQIAPQLSQGSTSDSVVSANLGSIAPAPESWFNKFRQTLLGKPIPIEEVQHERVAKFKALAILSSDALSSVAYGTEASLAVLLTAGVATLHYNLFIGMSIIVLLAVVAFSYRQTIQRYPGGGGSYIVARDNLGQRPALVAAAALLIDYVLTVSVSVSAGVDALTSAIPVLIPYNVPIGLVLIALIMLINIRGVRESGNIFTAPTYLFVGSFLIMILAGLANALTHGGLFTVVPAPHSPDNPVSTISQIGSFSLPLLLTAFASGCSAMTGTEAISDAVPIFKGRTPPDQARNAGQTLAIMATLLAVMYGGTTYLAWRFGFQPQANSQPTLISIMANYFFPGFWKWFYYLFQFATTLILVLAANTSFADFPRLSFFLARDEYLPHMFQLQGDRLAFNTGIVALGVLSSLLLVIFHGNTEALINLYALGVFLAFTLSQSSMVVRWVRKREEGWRHGLPISAFGAFATAIVTVIITLTKFDRGAWVVVLLIPAMFLGFRGIHRHYQVTREHLNALDIKPDATLHNHLVIVPISDVNQLAKRALFYAKSLSRHVVAVSVIAPRPMAASTAEQDVEAEHLQEAWKTFLESEAWRTQPSPTQDADDEGQVAMLERDAVIDTIDGPKLVVIRAPDRATVSWIIRFIDTLAKNHPSAHITVILPEFVPKYFWEWFLHNQVALRLKWAMLRRPRIVTSNVPYRIDVPS